MTAEACGTAVAGGGLMDMEMLLVNNGRERTAGEYRRLFDATGFRLTRVVDTAASFSIIEARAD